MERSGGTTDTATVIAEALVHGPLSGHEIATACAGRVAGDSLTWLYPALNRMEAVGAIVGEWHASGTSLRRRYFLLGAAPGRFGVWRSLVAGLRRASTAAGNSPVGETPTATEYLDRLVAALPEPEAGVAIRRELAEHISDARVGDGAGPSLERLFGQPEQLARALQVARSNRRSTAAAVRWALPISLGIFLLSTALTAFTEPWLRAAAEVIVRIISPSDMWMSATAMDQRQQSFPVLVGAFVATRYWAGAMLATGRAAGPLVVGCGAIVCLAFGVPAVFMEVEFDALSALVMAGIPAAAALGTVLPARPGELPVSGRGAALAAGLAFAVLVAPLNGVLGFSAPGGIDREHPGVHLGTEPIADFDTLGAEGWFFTSTTEAAKEVCVEAKPLRLVGWRAEIDEGATGMRLCQPVEVEKFVYWSIPAPQVKGQYWIVLVSASRADGTTTTVAGSLAVPRTPQSIAGWLADTLSP